jgi:DNA-binding HxlR family transcriptional regulator
MSRPTRPTLFDDPSPGDDESMLLEDLDTLVALGLLEERPSPEGPVYVLTELGVSTPEFGA